MKIPFKEMKLDDDGIKVRIIGEAFGYKIPMKVSILQLAKIFGRDKEVVEECGKAGFGSEELEEKCEETRGLIEKFPDIKVWDNKLKFDYVSVEDNSWKRKSSNPDVIQVYAEDLVGWNNEGILIALPKELYDKELRGKQFEMFVKPFLAEFDIKKSSE